MDRLISEQAVIDRLSHWYSNMLETGKEQEDLIEVIKAIPSAEPKWIPCSERLPQYTDDYTVTVGINNGYGMYYEVRTALYQVTFNQWIVYESEKTLVGEVIAWQDSLEPYKTERE